MTDETPSPNTKIEALELVPGVSCQGCGTTVFPSKRYVTRRRGSNVQTPLGVFCGISCATWAQIEGGAA